MVPTLSRLLFYATSPYFGPKYINDTYFGRKYIHDTCLGPQAYIYIYIHDAYLAPKYLRDTYSGRKYMGVRHYYGPFWVLNIIRRLVFRGPKKEPKCFVAQMTT